MRKLFICCLMLIASLQSGWASGIVVTSLAAGKDYQTMVAKGVDNKRAYCKLHGYRCLIATETLDASRPIPWSKIPLILQAMEDPKARWIFWSDADSLIMNLAVPVEQLIDERYNLIIAKDFNGINSGQFLIRNCEWSRQFLKEVYAHTECINHHWWEQAGIIAELGKNPTWYDKIKFIPQRLINSYAREFFSDLRTAYQPGDFVVHFPGVHGRDALMAMFDTYAPQVVNSTELITLDYYLGVYGHQLTPAHSSKNEGYVTAAQQEQFLDVLAEHPEIERVVEIGLNAGHSADIILRNCDNLTHFISFDINKHRYTPAAIDYFSRFYPNVFRCIEGSSLVKVPEFVANHPDTTVDLIYIDGSHEYDDVIKDIVNCQPLAHRDTLLWIDDYNGESVREAVHKCRDAGILAIDAIHQSKDPCGSRCWIEAHYLFNN
jgi:predicted O-methyltransferase YrrM